MSMVSPNIRKVDDRDPRAAVKRRATGKITKRKGGTIRHRNLARKKKRRVKGQPKGIM